jgi:hypothetical protein
MLTMMMMVIKPSYFVNNHNNRNVFLATCSSFASSMKNIPSFLIVPGCVVRQKFLLFNLGNCSSLLLLFNLGNGSTLVSKWQVKIFLRNIEKGTTIWPMATNCLCFPTLGAGVSDSIIVDNHPHYHPWSLFFALVLQRVIVFCVPAIVDVVSVGASLVVVGSDVFAVVGLVKPCASPNYVPCWMQQLMPSSASLTGFLLRRGLLVGAASC